MNAISEEVMAEMEAEKWKDGEMEEEKPHPLVEACSELAIEIRHEVKAEGWKPDEEAGEHPIAEIINGVMIASTKLAGALGMRVGEEEWPPDRLFAGDVLVRLKKARNRLRDAMRGLDSADEEDLCTPAWRQRTRLAVSAILARTQQHIDEARAVLKNEG